MYAFSFSGNAYFQYNRMGKIIVMVRFDRLMLETYQKFIDEEFFDFRGKVWLVKEINNW